MLIIMIIILVPLIYFARRLYTFVTFLQDERRLKREIIIIRAENEVLTSRIHRYRRNVLLEAKARDDLGMIRPGERAYLVPRE